MFEFMQVVKALADENRVRMILALQVGELCVCQMTELLSLAPSTTSKHLSILRQSRLIEARKKGKWVYYTLPDRSTAPKHIAEALGFVLQGLHDDAVIQHDKKMVASILAQEKKCADGAEQSLDAYHSLAFHECTDLEDLNK